MKPHVAVIFGLLLLQVGCANTASRLELDGANSDPTGPFTSLDADKAVRGWINEILQSEPVASRNDLPRIGFGGIRNISNEPIDMVMFEQAFEYLGSRTGKIQIINIRSLPASSFDPSPKSPFPEQLKTSTSDKETAVRIGKLQGWHYVLYGELYAEPMDRFGRTRTILYHVIVHMVDTETGEQVWNSRSRFAKTMRKKLLSR